MTDNAHERLGWLGLGGMIVFHLGALAAFLVGASPVAVAVCLVLGAVRGFGITIGYHRYFSHRAFKTGRVMRSLLALLGSSAGQGSLFWWVSHHRDHHKYSDQARDIHSPVAHGFFDGHMGWLLRGDSMQPGSAPLHDWKKYPELVWIDRAYGPLMIAQGAALFALGAWIDSRWPAAGTSGAQMLVWGLFVSMVLLLHVTFCVNSVCHRFGRRVFETDDNSRNNAVIGVLALGEGWHNNHHAFPWSARLGLRWWQFDPSWLVLRVLQSLRLVRDLRVPSGDDLSRAA